MSDSGVNDQLASNESEGGLPKASPGARLATLREEQGWTVEQVASQLNLAPRQILAIERDDYPALPGMAIVRGFVRAYAKLLRVDAAPLLADLGGESVLVHDSLIPQKSLSTPFADSRVPSMAERPGLSSKWVVGTLLLVLLAVGIWAARQDGESAAVSSVAKPAVKDDGTGMVGKDENKPPLEVKSESNTPAVAVPEVQQQPAVQMPTAPVATPAKEPASDVPTSNDKDALQLTAREESWIEVRRSGDNSVLLSRIVKPGETEMVSVIEPVSVVIGNASGVEATLRGVRVELKASSKSNIARLNLK